MTDFDKPDNLIEMFEQSAKRFARNRWLGTKNRSGQYEWVTYGEVAKRIDHLRGGLAALGLTKGDTICIIANNRVEWAMACYAA